MPSETALHRCSGLACLLVAAVLLTGPAFSLAAPPADAPSPASRADARQPPPESRTDAPSPESPADVTSPASRPAHAPSPESPADAHRYAGSARCVSCHPRQGEAWQNSQHRLAMREAGPAALPSTFDAPLPATADYALVRDGNRTVARSTVADRCGDAPLRYTFGVDPLQQYLVECEDGRLQALPLAQDTRPSHTAANAWFPVYGTATIARGDRLHWEGRFQNANSRCIDCHTTGFEKNYRRDRDGYESRWTEAGVGCEACHGPGAAHAAQATALSADDSAAGATTTLPGWTRAPSEKTAHRTSPRTDDRQVEVCAICHSRREPLTNGPPASVALFDRYLPGVIDDHYEADGQDRDEVYTYGSFLQSRMFRHGVVCSDCHDPHGGKTRASGNALCAGCHDPGVFDTREHHGHRSDSTGASCVECHMPRHTYMQIDERRDHGLRIPRPDLTVRYGVPNACTSCHTDRNAEWAVQALRSRGQLSTTRDDRFVQAMHAAQQQRPDADALLIAVAGSEEIPAIQRASALAALRDVSAAPAVDAIRLSLSDPSALRRAWAARSLPALPASLRWKLAEPLLDDPTLAVRVEVARALAPLRGSLSKPESRRRLDPLLAEYRRSLLANEDQPEACVNLGLLDAYGGDLVAAEAAYRQALRIDPRSVLALVNLADLRRLQNDENAAEELLRRAVAIAPDDAGTHHALGLLLQRRGRTDDAIAEVARAAELAPGVAGYSFTWAVALRSAGRRDDATKVLEDAIRRHPHDAAMPRLLADLRSDANDAAAGRRP